MADVFNSETTFGKSFKGTMFKIGVGSSSGETTLGALVQDFAVQYQRQITRLFELGSRQQSYVEGVAAGQLRLSQIVGPVDVVDSLLSDLGDICRAEDNNVVLSAGAVMCDGDAPQTIAMTNAVATAVGLTGNVGNFVIQKSLDVMFATLDVG